MKRFKVNKGRYVLSAPDHIASWDAIIGGADWEGDRLRHMEATLTKSDVLFDVGTEQGWMSVIYAQFTDPAKMVLFEPSPDFWPNIRETWLENHLPLPQFCWPGFVGAKSTVQSWPERPAITWPASSYGPICTEMAYRYMHNPSNLAAIPTTTLDDFCTIYDIYPTALTIDVEGAELEVLKGAKDLLTNHKIKVWCSVHPDLMERDYKTNPGELNSYMENLGYTWQFLGQDHEVHGIFS